MLFGPALFLLLVVIFIGSIGLLLYPANALCTLQVKRLLACSYRPPKPKRKRKEVLQPTRSAPSVPVPESNIGNQLLRGLGWQEGQGLGVTQSGIKEPFLPERRTGRQGLGC